MASSKTWRRKRHRLESRPEIPTSTRADFRSGDGAPEAEGEGLHKSFRLSPRLTRARSDRARESPEVLSSPRSRVHFKVSPMMLRLSSALPPKRSGLPVRFHSVSLWCVRPLACGAIPSSLSIVSLLKNLISSPFGDSRARMPSIWPEILSPLISALDH
jgi:hypothetical protein